MKHRWLARVYEMHGILVLFAAPLMIVFFSGLSDSRWTGYVFLAEVVTILLFFFRKGWMAFLRSKFPNLDLYAVRMILGGNLLMSFAMIEESLSNSPESLTSFGKFVGFPGLMLILIAALGTYCQGFIESVRELTNLRKK